MMSATREHRNACAVEDAVEAIRKSIATAQNLLDALAAVLPDDYPYPDVEAALSDLRTAAIKATEVTS